ncbi:MAG TPA: 4-oxalocrotonate tautomerase [Deltaproteobacteria bacterium]|nr:4-oxalocrotonate tautomerase [Deltaproteobacteria bacterium]
MPHVIVKLYTGRNEEQKKGLAEEVAGAVVRSLGCEKKVVSVAIEEIDRAAWPDQVYRPDILENNDKLYLKPGYDPFGES